MSQNKRSLAPSARTSFFDLVADIIDAFCNIVFLLIQLELRKHPTNLLTFRRDCGLANRPKKLRIHLAASRVRFYLSRFNSIGNFCDGGAICSRGTVSARNLTVQDSHRLLRLFDRARVKRQSKRSSIGAMRRRAAQLVIKYFRNPSFI
jgi:hypothetical protein